jgi:hypothetical protein
MYGKIKPFISTMRLRDSREAMYRRMMSFSVCSWKLLTGKINLGRFTRPIYAPTLPKSEAAKAKYSGL